MLDLEKLNREKAKVARKTGLDITTVDAGENDAVLIVQMPRRLLLAGEVAKFKVAYRIEGSGEMLCGTSICQAIVRAADDFADRIKETVYREVWTHPGGSLTSGREKP